MASGGWAVMYESVKSMSSVPFVVVSGPPASGKTTLAGALSWELKLPLVSKDTIKDALMSVLPVPNVEASQQLGRASVRAMLAVASASPVGAVIESNFYRSLAAPELALLPGTVIELFCRCDREVALTRYADRAGSRHAGHFDHERKPDEIWNEEICEPVNGGWKVIEVNTNEPIDLQALLKTLREDLLN